jgi:hypothetical protein
MKTADALSGSDFFFFALAAQAFRRVPSKVRPAGRSEHLRRVVRTFLSPRTGAKKRAGSPGRTPARDRLTAALSTARAAPPRPVCRRDYALVSGRSIAVCFTR